MADFNPLDYPCCLSYPLRLAPTAWAAHVPFAMFLVDALRPGTVVELGTFSGVSYCAFCQAVKELKLNARLFAIDTWQGDEQSGYYHDEILKDLKEHHDPLYEGFSTLIQSTFDEALAHFADGTIDLLHIDGYHAYTAVKHDFESWLPKMSGRGVMLLHDTNVRERDFGVWKLWEELKPLYPHFEFGHEHGLGLIATGDSVPERLRPLLEAPEQDATLVRQFFGQMGQRLKVRLESEHRIETISWQVRDKEETVKALRTEFAAREQKTAALARESEAAQKALHTELAAREQKIASLIRESEAAQEELRKEIEARQRDIESLGAELAAKEGYLRDILNSRAWRLVTRYWRIRHRSSQSLAQLFRRSHVLSRAAPRPETFKQPEEGADFHESLTLLPAPKPEELEAVLYHSAPLTPLHRPGIICFSIIDWEFRYQRPQQIMSQFAAHGHRVFYIRLDHFLSNNASPRFSIKQLKENLYEVRLAARRHQWVNLETIGTDNRESLLRSLDELRRTLRVDEAIGYVQIPSWADVALAARERWGWRIVYDCMDEWEGFPGLGRSIATVEPQLVEGCDLLVTTAQRLYNKWRTMARQIVLARNAVDYDFYVARYHPNDLLAEADRPIVGYYGAIAGWFDVELMTYVARARPGYTFVLLGGVFDVDTSELEALPNVRLLGQRPYEEMPQYLYHFDVCLIPFKLNSTTEATDPVKLYEYLSAGKAVVSVALPELEPFGEHLYLAADRDDFIVQLDRAVAEDDPERAAHRRRFAAQNTWPERYRAIIAGLKEATPRASIIIVTYHNLALTKLCLESIIRHTAYPDYEIIVVDNNSSDGTPAYLRYMAAQHPHLHIILNSQNEGFARATNQGIARSTGQYLVLLNNDTVVPPGWLSRLLRHLEDPQVGMVGPVTNFAGNEARIDAHYRTWAEMLQFASERTWNYDALSADIEVLAMFCVALRRETYEAVGPLDEQFRIGMFEDDDYKQRLKKRGYRIVCAADVFVHHFGQAAFKKLIERGEYDQLFDENRRRYETKWNTKWIPHRHGALSFERVESSHVSGSSVSTAHAAGNGSNNGSTPLPAHGQFANLAPAWGYFDRIGFCEGEFVINGWMFAPAPLNFSSFAFYINRALVSVAKPQQFPQSKFTEAMRAGVASTFQFRTAKTAQVIPDFSRIEVVGCQGQRPVMRLTTLFRSDMETRVPTPPEELMYRVTGNRNGQLVKAAGLRCACDFLDAICRHRDLGTVRRMLDWGCGCGRVTVHLMHYLSKYDGLEVYGGDIDAEAIDWCNRNLRAGFFSRIEPLPPTPWSDATFDVVVSCSVFTHLTKEAQHAWLAELRRIIAPGGLLLASVKSVFPGSRIPEEGISDETLDPMLDGIAPEGYYRGTFQTRDYTLRQWSKYFEILEFIERGIEGTQDLVVMCKRA